MKEKVLVLAYPGSGKTYLADNFKDVCDFEHQHYRYDYVEFKHLSLEQLKGNSAMRKDNPGWPNNFFKALDEELEKVRIVLIPFASSLIDVLEFLEKSDDIRAIFAIQDKDTFEDLANNFRQRGSSEEFIERRRKDFQKCHEIIANSKYEKAYIHRGEHLYDALTRLGIKLEKGKGYKNYF